MSDQLLLQDMAKEFFSSLYTEELVQRPVYYLSCMFPALDNVERERVSAEFSDEDIRRVLFDMKPWKASGIDGIQAGVFQVHWDTLGMDLRAECLRVLHGSSLIPAMNRTTICLIPK